MAGYWPRSFFANLWTLTTSRSITTQKKNLANIHLSWHHTWSIIHTWNKTGGSGPYAGAVVPPRSFACGFWSTFDLSTKRHKWFEAITKYFWHSSKKHQKNTRSLLNLTYLNCKWTPTWQPETNKNVGHWVLLQNTNLSLDEQWQKQ